MDDSLRKEGTYELAGLRPIGFAVLLLLLVAAGCNRSKQTSSETSARSTPEKVSASITMQLRVAGRRNERRHLPQIFRMRGVVVVGFGLGIDACWPRDANSVLNVLSS